MNVVGHRGASQAHLENTPAAFEAADAMGADGVELDVRIASDGRGGFRLVVHHDALPDAQADVDALSSFDEALDACGDRMLVNVEIKNGDGGDDAHDPTMAVVAPTIAAMRARGRAWADRWLISSFSLATIDHCRRVAPDIDTALLVWGANDVAIASAVAGGHRYIHPWVNALDAERVVACHRAGLGVNAWTCNDAAMISQLAEFGVDGVCTDVPDEALVAVGRSPDVVVSPRWGRPA
jgi:glycerophosphoryl diester phosphodiesterase